MLGIGSRSTFDQSPNLPENFQAYVDGQKIPPFAQVKFAPYQNLGA